MDGSVSALPPAAELASPPLRPLWVRAIGLVSAPRSVFEQLAGRPAWFWATVVTCAVALVVTFVIYDPVILPTMIERAEQQGLASAQLAQVEAAYASAPAKIATAAWAAAANFGALVVIGLLLYAACSFLLGGKAKVKHALAVAGHAMLVHVPRSLILLPVMLVRGDPYASLGPGVLFPPAEAEGFAARFLAMFLNNAFDLFNLWSVALCILGMSVVSRLPVRQTGLVLGVGYGLLSVLWALALALMPQ
jgi:hypothetical protein